MVEVNGEKMVVLRIRREKVWEDLKVDSGEGLQSVKGIVLEEANDRKRVMLR
ncbi:hypothetical protein [Staphylococcus auricularis]|uniref:hypothetical protein n=1 Tax=Staphylococcus auricularis TaxID=29379 RepID=UPI001782B593|nr:hypothetical protein [Staphylococcus auricularis]